MCIYVTRAQTSYCYSIDGDKISTWESREMKFRSQLDSLSCSKRKIKSIKPQTLWSTKLCAGYIYIYTQICNASLINT